MLDFTPSERRVIIIIAVVLIGSAGFQYLKNSVYIIESINYQREDSIFSRYTHQARVISEKSAREKYADINLKTQESGTPQKSTVQLRLNINIASAEELKQLPRIGPSTAKKIIAYRTKNGPFKTINELRKVKGIGLKTLERIKPYLQDLD